MLVLAMASIPGGAAVAKRVFPVVGAEGVTALRIGIAAALLLIIWRPNLSVLKQPVVLAYGVSLGIMNLVFYQAIARIPLGVAVALEFSGPLAVAMAASRKPMDFVWVALAIGGIGLLLPVGTRVDALDPVGVALALAAGGCWAAYILFGKRAGGQLGPKAVSVGMLVAALIAVPVGVAKAGTGLLAPDILMAGAAVALLSSLFPYSLEMVALTRLPTRVFGVMMSLEPAFAALSGLILLHEALTARQWTAIACIMAASIGSAATARMGEPSPHAD
jgi:inner membrane transporter RhtA